jgi:hypothetical protein
MLACTISVAACTKILASPQTPSDSSSSVPFDAIIPDFDESCAQSIGHRVFRDGSFRPSIAATQGHFPAGNTLSRHLARRLLSLRRRTTSKNHDKTSQANNESRIQIRRRLGQRLSTGGTHMKKLIVLALVVLGLLAIVPAMELQSSTQVFSRIGMAESGGGE